MNQILSIEMGNKNGSPRRGSGGEVVEIKKVVKFFAISMIIFALCLIGNGSYSIYKESQENESPAITKPIIQITDLSETEIRIEAQAGVNLAKVLYSWDDGEEIEINCIGKKEINEIIERPSNKKELSVYAKDINGQETTGSKVYNDATVTENKNIKIEIKEDGTQIKVTAECEDTQLLYMTYRWDEEEEEKVEIDDTYIEETIDVPLGEHTLTVIVVDENNNTKTEEQIITGITKPKIEIVGVDDSRENVILKVTADDGINKIEVTLNEEDTTTMDLSDKDIEERKEQEVLWPIQEGENKIKIVVYSEGGATKEMKKSLTK